MPGAQLEASDGDEHRGSIKVKLGPISATYAGVAAFESLDRAERTAVLRAEGADTRGQGKASALITASFRETGTGTRVAIDTELTITGKVAQFGRGSSEERRVGPGWGRPFRYRWSPNYYKKKNQMTNK